jgi:hypothetical protein
MGKMQSHVAAIRAGVPEVGSYALVPNTAGGNKGYNWAILSSFASAADLASYQASAPHQAFVAFGAPYIDDFLILDYEAA